MRFRELRLVVLFAAVLGSRGTGFAGRITVSLPKGSHVCREVKLPKWQGPSTPLQPGIYDWFHLLLGAPAESDWRFRLGGPDLLIRTVGYGPPLFERAKDPDRYYSGNISGIDPASGRIRAVDESEWARGTALPMVRKSTLPNHGATKPMDRVVYLGHDFPRRGHDWPLLAPDVARLSEDGMYLVVFGWDGHRGGYGDLVQASGSSDGNYYVDFYAADSAVRMAGFQGHFHELDFDHLFEISAWASSRYFVFPLNETLDRLVLCDAVKITGAASR